MNSSVTGPSLQITLSFVYATSQHVMQNAVYFIAGLSLGDFVLMDNVMPQQNSQF